MQSFQSPKSNGAPNKGKLLSFEGDFDSPQRSAKLFRRKKDLRFLLK